MIRLKKVFYLMQQHLYKTKIRTKVLLFALLVSTLPVIVLGYYSVKSTYADLEQQILEQQKIRVNSIAQYLSSQINEVFISLELLEGVADLEQQPVLVYDLLRRNSSLNEIVFIDLAGEVKQVYSRFGVNRWLEGEKWLTNSMNLKLRLGQRAWGELEQNQYVQPSIKLLVPVWNAAEREIIGGLGAELQLQKPLGELSQQKLHQGEIIYLMDNREKVISQGLPPTEEGEVLATKAFLPEFGWTVVIEQSRAEAFAPMRSLLFKTIFNLVLLVLIIGIISTQISLSFIQPLETLQRSMSKVKEGYWPHEVPITRGDELGQLAVAFYDMTKQLESKSRHLLQEKERLDVIIGSIGAGLAVIREDYRIIWLNKRFQDWLPERLHLPCYHLLRGQDEPCANCHAFTGTGDSETDQVLTLINSKGEKRVLRYRMYRLQHTLDSHQEALLLMEDITRQKEIEEKLLQANKLSALGQVASGFAHEVNNPLATIEAYAEDLIDRLDEDGVQFYQSGSLAQYLEVIKGNVERCKKITGNLLHFSRPSHWQEEWFRVEEVIENSLSMVRPMVKKMGITVNVEIPKAKDLPLIKGEPFKLIQVILNILNNSIDAMSPNGGILTVSTSTFDNHVHIHIVDTGAGMSGEELKKVFDPFYTTKLPGEGTGLGLSICYEIIQQFQGAIGINSTQGKGTEVVISIPSIEGRS